MSTFLMGYIVHCSSQCGVLEPVTPASPGNLLQITELHDRTTESEILGGLGSNILCINKPLG
jgi:hypothetical protein